MRYRKRTLESLGDLVCGNLVRKILAARPNRSTSLIDPACTSPSSLLNSARTGCMMARLGTVRWPMFLK